jgi:hypothetical protein
MPFVLVLDSAISWVTAALGTIVNGSLAKRSLGQLFDARRILNAWLAE